MNDTPLPTRYVVDENGVNLANGYHYGSDTVIASIGSGPTQLSIHTRDGANEDGLQAYNGAVQVSGSTYSVTIPGTSREQQTFAFTLSGSSYVSSDGKGATLVNGSPGYVLTTADGTVYTYGFTVTSSGEPWYKARLTHVQFTNGSTLSLVWQDTTYCSNNLDYCSGGTYITKVRLQSVTSSYGYQIHNNYQSNDTTVAQMGAKWDQLSKMVLLNLADDYCDPNDYTCSLTQSAATVTPTTSYSGSTYTLSIQDPMSRTTSYSSTTQSGGTAFVATYPNSSQVSVQLDTNGRVSSITRDGSTWTYSFSLSGTTMTATVTNPDGTHRTVVSDTTVGLPTSVTDELSHTISFSYDSYGRLSNSTTADGNSVHYTYDARGNVTQTDFVPKSGSGLATLTATASYPSTCTNTLTCNQPTWTKDTAQNETDYAYDPATGLVTSVTQPAVNGVRPQVRYNYTSAQAVYKNSAGSLVSSGVPTTVLSSVSQCMSQTSCSGTADEQKASVTYNGNLLPATMTVAAGDGSLTSTTTLGYDAAGNVTSVDGPLSGTADTSNMVYDADREVTLAITPDPDGAGSLPRIAQQTNRDAGGQVTSVQEGTTDAAGGSFSVTRQVSYAYDPYGRKTAEYTQGADGTAYAVTQYSYTNRDQLQCTAIRMNSAAWGSLPGDACTLQTAGGYGPDRITELSHDATGRVLKKTGGVGTSSPIDEATATYTPGGKIATLIDANGNQTTYSYDGLDRLSTTTYPDGSYAQLTYFANSNNIQTRRTRGGDTLIFGYDALNRLTSKLVPAKSGVPAIDTRSVYYGYDLLGHPLYARFDNPTGEGVTFAVNALGEITSTTQLMDGVSRTLSYQYDAAGGRTRLTYPDGNYVTDYRDTLDRLYYAAINGNSLFYPPYNADGSIAAINHLQVSTGTWSSDTQTSFAYDALGRLSSLSQGLAGTSYDTSQTFAYNPASQITSRSNTNDSFSWHSSVDGTTSYTPNVLNEYSAVAGTSYTYDGNGNLTHDNSYDYTYDVENRLVSSNGVTLRYDPLGRLYEVVGSTTGTTRFLYDGDDLVAEYDGAGTMLRRYVHGEAASDDPVVWFEGSSVADSARRYLYKDERGSIVAVSDDNGNEIAINSYDEYGVPDDGSVSALTTKGRFRYTGQIYIPELGMYYYKARMYSPTLGRFMQTDPIGYSDGMNMYRYVGGDPINGSDPTGLATQITVTAQRDGQCGSVSLTQIVACGENNLECPPGMYYFGGACYNDALEGWKSSLGRPSQNSTGGSSQSGNAPAPQSKPPCTVNQKQLQQLGNYLGKAGTYGTVASLVGGGVSALAGVAGIVTADPVLAYYGGEGVEYSAQGYKISAAFSTAGAAISLLGQNGAPVDREAINLAVTSALGSSLNEHIKSAVELGLDKAEEHFGLFEGDTGCR